MSGRVVWINGAFGAGKTTLANTLNELVTVLPAVALLFVVSLYQWFSTATDGTTIGKRLMGIRIERDDGKRLGFRERAGTTPRWLRNKTVRRLPERCAAAGYFNLHAAVRIGAQDKKALERLCRYVQRPPLSHDRLSVAEDGRTFLRFKRGWDDGTTGVFLTGGGPLVGLTPAW